MRTSDFIEKQAKRIMNGERGRGRCASVFAEGDCIYSYGYHYPLFFKVSTPRGDVMIVNRRGYSVTTSKHINYCYRQNGLSVELLGTTRTYDNVIASLNNELDSLSQKMNAKKRKDTHVFRALEYAYNRAQNALNILR